MSEGDMRLPIAPFQRRSPDDEPCCRPDPHIIMRSVSIGYGTRLAVRDVDLTMNRGCITSVVGPSGCGKSSLLASVNRLFELVPGCTVQGSILIDGENVLALACDVAQLRMRIGMIFQNPSPFPISIRNNIHLPLRDHGMKSRHERDAVMQTALEDVGLWSEVRDRLHRPARTLSGGQQQRLCIARALALKPGVILYDEPCSALDPLASAVIEDLIVSMQGRITQVVVTHNLAQARRVADHVAVMWLVNGAGCIVEAGDAAQIFSSPQHEHTQRYISGERG
ncbi:MAG: phosphate ABC transporter ATP-binding protein [Phycisphaerales bacterium]